MRRTPEAEVRAVVDYVRTYSDELAELTYEPERAFETLRSPSRC